MPTLLGITYGFSKALPKIFTNSLITTMYTETHLGKKLEKEAARLGMNPTQVAAYFGVKPPSVYGWYAKGSIHHKHFYKLVQLTGKPLEWWFDFPEQTKNGIDLRKYSGLASNLAELFDCLPDDPEARGDALLRCSSVIGEIGARKPAQQRPEPRVFPLAEKRNE